MAGSRGIRCVYDTISAERLLYQHFGRATHGRGPLLCSGCRRKTPACSFAVCPAYIVPHFKLISQYANQFLLRNFRPRGLFGARQCAQSHPTGRARGRLRHMSGWPLLPQRSPACHALFLSKNPRVKRHALRGGFHTCCFNDRWSHGLHPRLRAAWRPARRWERP